MCHALRAADFSPSSTIRISPSSNSTTQSSCSWPSNSVPSLWLALATPLLLLLLLLLLPAAAALLPLPLLVLDLPAPSLGRRRRRETDPLAG